MVFVNLSLHVLLAEQLGSRRQGGGQAWGDMWGWGQPPLLAAVTLCRGPRSAGSKWPFVVMVPWPLL